MTVRGTPTVSKPAKLPPRWVRNDGNEGGNSTTPLLDAIVSAQEQRSKSRTRAVLAALILIVAMIGLWRWSTARTSSIPIPTLQAAIASGEVIAEFSGIGGSSGDSVKMRVARGMKAASRTVGVSLPAGSILASEDPVAQNMMVANVRGIDRGGNSYEPESQITLTEGAEVTFVVAAYCTQFEKENPSSATRFTLEQPDSVLACIAQKGSSLTVPAMQAAVWMKTDHIALVRMKQKFPITSQEWVAGRSIYQECRNPRNLVKGMGNKLDKIVLDVVMTWRFHPATVDGKPVSTQAELIFPFNPSYRITDS